MGAHVILPDEAPRWLARSGFVPCVPPVSAVRNIIVDFQKVLVDEGQSSEIRQILS